MVASFRAHLYRHLLPVPETVPCDRVHLAACCHRANPVMSSPPASPRALFLCVIRFPLTLPRRLQLMCSRTGVTSISPHIGDACRPQHQQSKSCAQTWTPIHMCCLSPADQEGRPRHVCASSRAQPPAAGVPRRVLVLHAAATLCVFALESQRSKSQVTVCDKIVHGRGPPGGIAFHCVHHWHART